MASEWNEFVKGLGYLLLIIAVWIILFGGGIRLGNPFNIFN